MPSDKDDVKFLLGEIKQSVADCRGDITEIKDEIMGNGQPGLKAEHITLRGRFNGLVGILKWMLGAATAVLVGTVIWLLTG